MTFAQLRSCNPASWHTAAATLRRLAAALDRRAADLEQVITGLRQAWTGVAADAAVASTRRQAATLLASRNTVSCAANLLDRHAAQTADRRAELETVLGSALTARSDLAESPQAEIHADGSITLRGPAAREITRVVREATEIDTSTAGQLREFLPLVALGADGSDPPDRLPTALPLAALSLAALPVTGSSPEAVRRWWDGLTPRQQDQVVRDHPERIGWLDGVPATGRDQANRLRLDRQRGQLDAERDALQSELDGLLTATIHYTGPGMPLGHGLDLADRIAAIDAELAGLADIAARLDGQPAAAATYLLGWNPDRGDGRVVVAVGNPDTADNVATFIPGTGADPDRPGRLLDRVDTIASDAERREPGQATAAILWLDYDAPQNVVTESSRDTFAEEVRDAGSLRRFADGLRATHEGAPSRNTVLGHSYGTTVIGYTAREPAGLDADALVLVGSPGVGVDHASDLHGVPTGQVWATTAGFDPIRAVPDFWYGDSPLDRDFGARQFGTDWDPRHGHTTYWSGDYQGNPVRQAMAAITTGHPSPPGS